MASTRTRFWALLAVLCVLPTSLFWYWRAQSMELFAHREPFLDLFFFHDASFVWLYALTLGLAAALTVYRKPLLPTLEADLGRAYAPVIAGFFVVAAALAIPVNGNVPLTMDEYAAIFQATIFAEGKWTAQIPLPYLDRIVLPQFLNYFLTSDGQGRVIESYLPGYALLLTPFAKIGAAWLLNPLLGALTLWLLSGFARKLFRSESAVGCTLLLVLASPVFWMNTLSFYSLNARFLFNLLFAYCLCDFTRRGAYCAGVAGGMAAFLHNPFPHAVFALPWLIYLTAKKQHRPLWLPLLLGYLPFVLLSVGWFALVWSFQTATPATTSFGQFTHAWDVQGALTPPPLSTETFAYLSILLCKLLLWTAPGLWLFFGLGKSKNIPLRLLVFSFLVTMLAYGLAGNRLNQGFGWGHRYTYAALGGIFLLSAAWLAREATPRFRNAGLVLVALGIAVIVPLRIIQSSRFIATQTAKLPCLPEEVRQVCLVSAHNTYFMNDRIQNDPFLRSPRLILASHGRAKDKPFMEAHFPDFELLRWDGQNGVWLPKTRPLE